MEKNFSYLGYPILKLNSSYLIYDINSGDVLSSTDYRSICEKLGKINPSQKSEKPNWAGLNFCLNFNCNLNCDYCSVNANKRSNIITEEIIDAAIKYVIDKKNLKELKVTFTGGEPTLAIDSIKYALNKLEAYPFKKVYLINTNGVVSKENLDYLLTKKFKFFISLDGTKEIHDAHRKKVSGEGSYEDVISTIKYLRSKGADVVLRSTLTKKTIKSLSKMILLANKLDVRLLRVTNVMECGRASIGDTRTPSAKEYAEEFHNSLKLARSLNILLVSSQFTNLFSPSINYCGTMAGSEIIVTPDGNLTSCFASYKKGDIFSDFFIYGEYNSNLKMFIIESLE